MRQWIAVGFLFAVCIVLALCVASAADAEVAYARVSTQSGPLNMRETASTQAEKIDEIPNGEIIAVTSRGDTWCACLFNGRAGFVMTKYLSFLDGSQFEALQPGDSGPDVLALKQRLQALYFYGPEDKLDDRYDAEAEAAVMSFQAAQGLELTGIATPELQAFLYWGPAKNNLPTKTMTVNISCTCADYNHVGSKWSQYFSVNDVRISAGDTLEIVLGETVAVYSRITDNDTVPDVGSVKTERVIAQEDFDRGFTVSQTVAVKENRGRYSGNKANWKVVFTFQP